MHDCRSGESWWNNLLSQPLTSQPPFSMLLTYPMSQQFNFACSNPFFFFAPAHTSWFCFALCLVHLAMFSLDGSHRHSRSQLPPPRGELKPATLLHGAAEGSREQEGSQRLPRAPGLPERGGTDPREEKGHTYLGKFLRFSGTLSLTCWVTLLSGAHWGVWLKKRLPTWILSLATISTGFTSLPPSPNLLGPF